MTTREDMILLAAELAHGRVHPELAGARMGRLLRQHDTETLNVAADELAAKYGPSPLVDDIRAMGEGGGHRV